ncbi:MAG TPA: hypothetical protein VFG87_08480 [Amycolatopsis sp.]|nr:hypothetical protein [Amycolatopsis sp.]
MRRNEAWRNGTSMVHRVAYLVTASLAGGVGLSALYTSRVLTRAVADVPEGRLFTLALFGALLGSFAVVPQWDRMPGRARAVVALLAVAAGYALFAGLSLAASPGLYQAGALLLGLAASPWIKVILQAGRWIEASNRLRTGVRWPATTWAGVLLGLTVGLAGVLTVQGALMPAVDAPGPAGCAALAADMRTAALATAGLAVLVALALAALTPSEAGGGEAVCVQRMLIGSFRALRHPYVATVAAAYGLSAGMLGAFDELWVRALPHSVPGWLPALLNFGVLSGSAVVLLVAFVGDRATLHRGGDEDFLARHARSLIVLFGAIMALGGSSVAVSQHLLGDPTAGIVLNAVLGEAGTTILIPLVDCLFKRRFPGCTRSRDEANEAVNGIKVLGQLGLGAGLGAMIWATAAWNGVSVLIAVLGTATFTTTAVVFLWPRLTTRRGPATQRAAMARAGTPPAPR